MWCAVEDLSYKFTNITGPINEPPPDRTNKMACAPSEDSDQTVHRKKTWVLGYPSGAQRILIRLSGCPGLSESSLGTHAILLVLSCVGSKMESLPHNLRWVDPLSRETILWYCFCLPSEKVSILKGKNLLFPFRVEPLNRSCLPCKMAENLPCVSTPRKGVRFPCTEFNGKRWRSWSAASFCGMWSGVTLFSQGPAFYWPLGINCLVNCTFSINFVSCCVLYMLITFWKPKVPFHFYSLTHFRLNDSLPPHPTHTTTPLRKHAYSNILKISPPKTENFQIKNWYFSYSCSKHRLWVLVSTHNLCFWTEIRKIMYTPCKPQLYYIKVGFKGVKII